MSIRLLVVPVVLLTLSASALSAAVNGNTELYGTPPNSLKEYLGRLVRFYPDTIRGYDDEFLYLNNGTKFHITDHRTDKTFQELLENPDVSDMFYTPYPMGTIPKQPAKNIDPGRVRFEPLFAALYGDCKKGEVIEKLHNIEWLPNHHGGSVRITRSNGVDKALEEVSRDLDDLPTDLIRYVIPTAGTYNCRDVAGTNYMSMHAYGAALDVNTKYANYWRWALNAQGEPKWQNQIPIEVIHVFEKHGFIWGGYWYHYDTMHFEYRPELLTSEGSPG